MHDIKTVHPNAIDQTRVTRADPIPVLASVRWSTGSNTLVHAYAIAWTKQHVQIVWQSQESPPCLRLDWVPATDVSRR